MVGRRVVVVAVVAAQVGFAARGYFSDHKEFAFQMFPEASTWRADIVRVTSRRAARADRAVRGRGTAGTSSLPNVGLR